MSLVLIWPSTVIRSKEPSTAARSAASGSSTDGVGLHEAEHRREARLIIPAPFAWAESVTPPARTRAALRAAVGGHDRRREVLAAVGGRAPAASATPPRRRRSERHADRSGLGDGHRARLHTEGPGGGVTHRQRVG